MVVRKRTSWASSCLPSNHWVNPPPLQRIIVTGVKQLILIQNVNYTIRFQNDNFLKPVPCSWMMWLTYRHHHRHPWLCHRSPGPIGWDSSSDRWRSCHFAVYECASSHEDPGLSHNLQVAMCMSSCKAWNVINSMQCFTLTSRQQLGNQKP